MANLLGQNIGTNYKGILSLDSTINTPLDATLRAVTDGEGNASGLKLSTTDSSFSGKLGVGTDAAPSASLQIQGDGTNDIARFFNADPIKTVFISNRGEIGAKSEFAGDGGFIGYNGNFGVQVFALKRNSVGGLAVQSLSNIGFSVNGANSVSSYEMELTDTGNLIIGGSSGTARLAVKGSGTTSSTTALLVQNSAGTNLLSVLDNGNVGIGTNTPTASIEATTFKSSSINDNGTVLQFLPSYNMYTLSQFSIGAGDMSARLGVKGYGTTSATTSLLVQNSSGTEVLKVTDDSVTNARGTINVLHPSVATRSLKLGWGSIFATDSGSELTLGAVFAVPSAPQILLAGNTRSSGANTMQLQASLGVSIAASLINPSAQLHVKGIGTTSATTALLVQNSSGTDLLKVTDDGLINVNNNAITNVGAVISVSAQRLDSGGVLGVIRHQGNQIGMGNNTTGDASALLTLTSTTKGFLPPRMTTTQKNAIATPASGLIVYDTDTNKLACYNGTTWNDLF